MGNNSLFFSKCDFSLSIFLSPFHLSRSILSLSGLCRFTKLLNKSVNPPALLPDVTVEEFFSSRGAEGSLFSRLGRTLAELLQTLPENVQIFSVGAGGQRGEKALNVWFAAHGSPYYKAEKLHGYVAANKATVRRELEPGGDLVHCTASMTICCVF